MSSSNQTTRYQVTGMTCGHCEAAVKGELAQVDGVESAEVAFTDGILVVTGRDDLDERAVLAAVDEAGYQAVRLP
ncbi:Copper chaperone CopZ [Nakamurella panacisegetis]|uniref:Copper chaperone CopZ n=1 Tax=Nakamurella panacisegetis TaxID=1090615 RepID=A0A1H0JXC1_9ACTN|nr:heavy metal-associated domain-containing protein [Nakamurella panacisegetis]SDO48162.1 Copper chaperone CopZ [Nakamurella panacisegetis]